MSTECSRNVHWNPNLSNVQWPFSEHCCWMAGTTQWPFSIYFLFWEEIFFFKNELNMPVGSVELGYLGSIRSWTDILFLHQEILHIWNGIIWILICIYFSSLHSSLKVSWLYYCCDGGSNIKTGNNNTCTGPTTITQGDYRD